MCATYSYGLHQLSVFNASCSTRLEVPCHTVVVFTLGIIGHWVAWSDWFPSCVFFRWWYLFLPNTCWQTCLLSFPFKIFLHCHIFPLKSAEMQTNQKNSTNWQLNTWSADVSPRMLLKRQRELRVASHWMAAMPLTQKSWRMKSGEANITTVSVCSSPSAPPASTY